jgi:DNA primase
MMLGKCAGGAVRLALANDTVAVAEGIEDALSVMQETGLPAWAALSTSGLKTLELPVSIINVTICADADEPGEKAAQEAAQRWLAEGRTVRIARPPGGHKDFNAALMAGTTQEISA